MKKASILLLLLTISGTGVFAQNFSLVKAYPVPFNPNQDSIIKILIPDGSGNSLTVSFSVYDINGDLVTKRSFAASTAYDGGAASVVTWNGRNSRGTTVDAGLYIIKVVIQNEDTGSYGKRILRILVKR